VKSLEKLCPYSCSSCDSVCVGGGGGGASKGGILILVQTSKANEGTFASIYIWSFHNFSLVHPITLACTLSQLISTQLFFTCKSHYFHMACWFAFSFLFILMHTSLFLNCHWNFLTIYISNFSNSQNGTSIGMLIAWVEFQYWEVLYLYEEHPLPVLKICIRIRVICKVTLSLDLLSPPWYPQTKEILLNLGMECWNSAFNAQGSRVVILVVQVGEVKIYVAH
jgi:hypothetical protein